MASVLAFSIMEIIFQRYTNHQGAWKSSWEGGGGLERSKRQQQIFGRQHGWIWEYVPPPIQSQQKITCADSNGNPSLSYFCICTFASRGTVYLFSSSLHALMYSYTK